MTKKLEDKTAVWDNTDEQRLVRIETQIINLTAVIAQSEESRAKWEDKVETRINDLSNANREDWRVIFSGIGLIIILATLTLTPIYTQMSTQNEVLKALGDRQATHIELSIERSSSTQKAIEYIEKRLDREERKSDG